MHFSTIRSTYLSPPSCKTRPELRLPNGRVRSISLERSCFGNRISPLFPKNLSFDKHPTINSSQPLNHLEPRGFKESSRVFFPKEPPPDFISTHCGTAVSAYFLDDEKKSYSSSINEKNKPAKMFFSFLKQQFKFFTGWQINSLILLFLVTLLSEQGVEESSDEKENKEGLSNAFKFLDDLNKKNDADSRISALFYIRMIFKEILNEVNSPKISTRLILDFEKKFFQKLKNLEMLPSEKILCFEIYSMLTKALFEWENWQQSFCQDTDKLKILSHIIRIYEKTNEKNHLVLLPALEAYFYSLYLPIKEDWKSYAKFAVRTFLDLCLNSPKELSSLLKNGHDSLKAADILEKSKEDFKPFIKALVAYKDLLFSFKLRTEVYFLQRSQPQWVKSFLAINKIFGTSSTFEMDYSNFVLEHERFLYELENTSTSLAEQIEFNSKNWLFSEIEKLTVCQLPLEKEKAVLFFHKEFDLLVKHFKEHDNEETRSGIADFLLSNIENKQIPEPAFFPLFKIKEELSNHAANHEDPEVRHYFHLLNSKIFKNPDFIKVHQMQNDIEKSIRKALTSSSLKERNHD